MMRGKHLGFGRGSIVACCMAAQNIVPALAEPKVTPPSAQSDIMIDFKDPQIVDVNVCSFYSYSPQYGRATAVVAIKNTHFTWTIATQGALANSKSNQRKAIEVSINWSLLQTGTAFVAFHEEAFIAEYNRGQKTATPVQIQRLKNANPGRLTMKYKPLLLALPQLAKKMFAACVDEHKDEHKIEKEHKHELEIDPGGRVIVELRQAPKSRASTEQIASASFPKSRSDCREPIFVSGRWMLASAGMTLVF